MSTTMRQSSSGGTIVGRPKSASALGVADGCTPQARSHPDRIEGRPQAWHPTSVCVARRRLAAGRYDCDELLDTVLDMVIEDFTS